MFIFFFSLQSKSMFLNELFIYSKVIITMWERYAKDRKNCDEISCTVLCAAGATGDDLFYQKW